MVYLQKQAVHQIWPAGCYYAYHNLDSSIQQMHTLCLIHDRHPPGCWGYSCKCKKSSLKQSSHCIIKVFVNVNFSCRRDQVKTVFHKGNKHLCQMLQTVCVSQGLRIGHWIQQQRSRQVTRAISVERWRRKPDQSEFKSDRRQGSGRGEDRTGVRCKGRHTSEVGGE